MDAAGGGPRPASARGMRARFLVVGGSCYLLTVAVNLGLKWTVLAGSPATAMLLATVVASVVSYAANKLWTFGGRGARRPWVEAALFALVALVGAGLSSAPVYVSRHVLGLAAPTYGAAVQEAADFVAGPILGTGLAMVVRWVALDRLVFPPAAGAVTGQRQPPASCPAGRDSTGHESAGQDSDGLDSAAPGPAGPDFAERDSAPGAQQASPRQARRPSRAATAAITSAASGSAQDQPKRPLSTRPARSTAER